VDQLTNLIDSQQVVLRRHSEYVGMAIGSNLPAGRACTASPARIPSALFVRLRIGAIQRHRNFCCCGPLSDTLDSCKQEGVWERAVSQKSFQ
jgi:hypothetical protein